MPTTIAGASVDLPEGWQLVTAALVAPPATPKAGLRTTNPAVRFNETMVLTREAVPPKTTPEIYIRHQMKGLGLSPVTSEARTHKGDTALFTEVHPKGPDGQRLVQLQLTVARPGEIWLAVVTTLDGPDLESRREQLSRVLDSVTFP